MGVLPAANPCPAWLQAPSPPRGHEYRLRGRGSFRHTKHPRKTKNTFGTQVPPNWPPLHYLSEVAGESSPPKQGGKLRQKQESASRKQRKVSPKNVLVRPPSDSSESNRFKPEQVRRGQRKPVSIRSKQRIRRCLDDQCLDHRRRNGWG